MFDFRLEDSLEKLRGLLCVFDLFFLQNWFHSPPILAAKTDIVCVVSVQNFSKNIVKIDLGLQHRGPPRSPLNHCSKAKTIPKLEPRPQP